MVRELLGGGEKRQASAQWSSQEPHLSEYGWDPVVWTREDVLPHESKVSSSFLRWHKQSAGCTRTSCHHCHPRAGELCFPLGDIARLYLSRWSLLWGSTDEETDPQLLPPLRSLPHLRALREGISPFRLKVPSVDHRAWASLGNPSEMCSAQPLPRATPS